MSPYSDIVTDTAATTGALLNARSLTRLGRAVGGLRRERGLTQATLAERAGVSRQWLNGLENGRIEGLEVGRLMRVLDTLGASLMIRDDARTSEEPE